MDATKKENVSIGDDDEQPGTSTTPFRLCEEAKSLGNIAVPMVLVQFSLYFLFPQGASAVGRFEGSNELAAFSLGSLTGNILCLSIIMGVLSAADTLLPRAYGLGEYRQVGILTVRTFLVACAVLFLPVALLSSNTVANRAFQKLGQDATVSELASSWVQVYTIGVPFVLSLRLMQRFLACQHIVWPMVIGTIVGCFLVQPLVMKWFVGNYGLLGSAAAIVITQMIQLSIVLIYLKVRPVYHPETWQDGLHPDKILEAAKLGPMIQFFRLGLGGVLSMTEWWFWEVVCFLVGHLGVVPLCVHTIAYNVIPVSYMIPLGFSIGLSVRVGHLLGSNEVQKAKTLAAWCFAFVVSLAVAWSIFVWFHRDFIIGLFTNDEVVVEGCRRIWHNVCIYLVLLFIYCFNGGLLRALGLQWEMAAVIIGSLWLCGLPLLWYVGKTKGGGIEAIWEYYPFLYALMDVGLITTSVTADWQGISDRIIRDRNAQRNRASEKTSLLPSKESTV